MTYNVFSGTLNPTHFTSLHDIQSATAEIRRGKKKKQDKNIMSVSVMQGGHKKYENISVLNEKPLKL